MPRKKAPAVRGPRINLPLSAAWPLDLCENCGALALYEADMEKKRKTKPLHVTLDSRPTDRPLRIAAEALVQVISNHAGAFIIGDLLSPRLSVR